jgi:hypothetical protein
MHIKVNASTGSARDRNVEKQIKKKKRKRKFTTPMIYNPKHPSISQL